MTTLDGGNVIKKGEGGGGTPINNQDKVVDITENGTTEVVADGGYTGLGKVTINTEVSGGGGELDGEYFLAKPNGKYKKIAFINGYVDPSDLSEDQLMAVAFTASLQAYGFCYSGFICETSGQGLDKRRFVQDPMYLAAKIGMGIILWNNLLEDPNYNYMPDVLNMSTCFAWEERDVSYQGVTFSFIEMAQMLLTEIFGNEFSVEEVYAFLQIEDLDKAVYDEGKNR